MAVPHTLRLILFLLLTVPLAAQNTTPFPRTTSIKGLQVQMVDDALALGIEHAGININLTALVDLEKKPGNPKRVVDGYEFGFNESYLKSLDSEIKPLSDKGVLVYIILIAYPSKNAAINALVIHPDARKDHKYTVGGFNAKTPEGKAWLKAASMEIASRWSGTRPEYGRVWGWIVGNEVNSHFMWYNIGKKPLADSVAEYALAFRIVHDAVRTASTHARLYISFDHHWGVGVHGISAEESVPGRDYLDTFAKPYAWEKCKRLPLVDAFIYHRHVDHAHEGGLRLGLWRNAPHSIADPRSKKQIWELFRKAGTPEWDAAAAPLLPVIGLKNWDELKGE
jgi:hypothetical protein